MIEYGITDEWNVQMRTSKHNCNNCVVTMETQWLPWQQLKDYEECCGQGYIWLYPTKSAKLTGYTTPGLKVGHTC